MQLRKKIGKLKFEIDLRRVQIVGIIAWVLILLVVPIMYDQSRITAPQPYTGQEIQVDSRVAAAFSDSNDFFEYTVDLSDRESLVSSLTLVFGILSGIIAIGSLVFIVRDRLSKEKVQN